MKGQLEIVGIVVIAIAAAVALIFVLGGSGFMLSVVQPPAVYVYSSCDGDPVPQLWVYRHQYSDGEYWYIFQGITGNPAYPVQTSRTVDIMICDGDREEDSACLTIPMSKIIANEGGLINKTLIIECEPMPPPDTEPEPTQAEFPVLEVLVVIIAIIALVVIWWMFM